MGISPLNPRCLYIKTVVDRINMRIGFAAND